MTIYDVEQSRVTINQQGEGEPIVFLHGVPDTAEIWSDTIQVLAHQYHCVAPDLPGFGGTQVPRNFDYSLSSLANFVKEMLQSLNISEAVHLVIHDIGGIVGLAFAVTHPEKVKSLTIMDTTFFSDHQWHDLANTWRKPIVGELAMYLMRYKQFSSAMRKSAPRLSAAQIQSNYNALTLRNRRMILRFYRALDPRVFKAWEEHLPSLSQHFPTQVIWGKQDSFLPPTLANRFGTDNVHVLENCGHWPMIDQADTVHNLLKNHLGLAGQTP